MLSLGLDILALAKCALRLFKDFRPKISVVKQAVGSNGNAPCVVVANMTDDPITLLDVGFRVRGHCLSVAEELVQPFRVRVEFPQTIQPRAALAVRIGPGAVDVWVDGDVYLTFPGGKQSFYELKPQLAAAGQSGGQSV